MKTVIMILGMHRSGTSSLAGSLQEKGLYLGTVYEANPFNLKGNRENQRIMALNDSILARSLGDWRTPPRGTVVWDEAHEQERDDIVGEFEASAGDLWGFKDPRSLFTFPFWKAGISSVRLVGTFRHPMSVARSLNFRNQIPIEDGLALWYAYNSKLLALHEEYGFPLISFDVPGPRYLASVDFVARHLGVCGSDERAGSSFFEEALRKHHDPSDSDVPASLMELHQHFEDVYARLQIAIQAD